MNETIKVYYDSLKKLFTDEGFTDSVKNLELFETLAQIENEDMQSLLRYMIDYANDITVSTMQLAKNLYTPLRRLSANIILNSTVAPVSINCIFTTTTSFDKLMNASETVASIYTSTDFNDSPVYYTDETKRFISTNIKAIRLEYVLRMVFSLKGYYGNVFNIDIPNYNENMASEIKEVIPWYEVL